MIVQCVQPRELDAAPFEYVSVSDVNKSRIVQAGDSAGKQTSARAEDGSR